MELFYENGHLTPEGLNALVDGQLDEMARLEAAGIPAFGPVAAAAEHLSFCDECLVRYTALVEQAPLAAPETPLAPGVWQRIRRRTWRIVTSRYATAAAAAAFALIIWGTGLFQNLGTPREVKPAPPAEPKAYSTVTSRMNEFVSETGRQINAAITDFFARFQKGAQQ